MKQEIPHQIIEGFLEVTKYQQAKYIILFCKIHDVKNRPDRFTDVAVFNVTAL